VDGKREGEACFRCVCPSASTLYYYFLLSFGLRMLDIPVAIDLAFGHKELDAGRCRLEMVCV